MAEKKEKFASAAQAESYLNKNKVKVSTTDKIITLSGHVGLKVLSAVDYLVNYHKYVTKLGA